MGGNRRTRGKPTTFGRVLTNSSHVRSEARYRAWTHDLSGGRTSLRRLSYRSPIHFIYYNATITILIQLRNILPGRNIPSLIIQTLHIAPWENGRERRVWYLTPLIASQNQLVDLQILCGPLETQENCPSSNEWILNGFKTLSRLSRSNSLFIEALWDAVMFPNVFENKFVYVI